VTGVSLISHLGLKNMAISFGFQEMPHWSINRQSLELLRRDEVTLGIGWQTMNSSQIVG